MKPIKTLVLLADDEKARLFESPGPGKGLSEIEDFSAALLDKDRIRHADRPGRSSAMPGVAQHAYDKAEAEHDQAQAAFARLVLDETEARFGKGSYDRFVMVAPPSMLGVLRAGLAARLKDALVADIAKDYLKLTPAEIVEHLAGEIAL
jgi:protein required for attachment to host cells